MATHSLTTVLLICMAFAGTHSAMVSASGKVLLARILGERFMKCYYRALFVVISAVSMTGAFFLIMSLPDILLYRAPTWLKALMHTLQIAGMIFGMMSLRVLDASEFFGLRQMMRCRKMQDLRALSVDGLSRVSLTKEGVYGIVRHPIYLAGIIMISLQPEITYNRLLVTVLADGYFLFAAFKEERRLLRHPGLHYEAYRREVPMFNILKGVHAKGSRRKGEFPSGVR